MRYYIEYYFKKYWYFMVLTLLVLLTIFIVYSNNKDISFTPKDIDNKVEFKPLDVTEEKIKYDSYISNLEVGPTYLPDKNGFYTPSTLNEKEKEEYLKKVAEDADYHYKKDINWANGKINNKEYLELFELVGYYLNQKSSNITVLIEVPTEEQLQQFEVPVMYYTDDKGTLYLNLAVEEIDKASNNKKSYCYTFQLYYDLLGRINIR